MKYTKLRGLIANDVELSVIADNAVVASTMNARTGSAYQELFLTDMDILNILDDPAGGLFLDDLTAAAQVNSTVKWAMKNISTKGVPLNSVKTQALLSALVANAALTAITQVEVDKLNAKLVTPSFNEENGFPKTLDAEHIMIARLN